LLTRHFGQAAGQTPHDTPAAVHLGALIVMRRLHHCAALLAFAAVAVCCACASADDKKEKPAFTGTWAKKDGNLKFECCDKNVIKFYPHGDKANFTIVCAYTLEKDGTVKAKITDFEGKSCRRARNSASSTRSRTTPPRSKT
jgi:hypothetical protein